MLSRILSLLFDESNRHNAYISGDYVHRIAQIGASKLVFTLLTFAITSPSFAQTSWTENASGYNIDLGGNKNGGFAFCDYDLDGDFDLVVNRNNRSYFYRNNGGSFTDVTSSVAPALAWDGRERCVVWGDLNNDGWPDFARNTSSDGVEVYLQDPSTNTFGDGTGGNTPQDYNGSASGSFYVADGMNSEGMGFLDYNGDGFLDIIFDNHDHGIDMLENDGTGYFTHVTAITGSYQWWNPASWPLGLAQESTDGDYGSTTDYDNDGWVDFISRKRDQVDFFRNVGGTFEESIDVAQASNGNRGAVNFSDFDNDGDFDLFWTENDDNQIFENDNGNFVALGNATGIPTGFGSNRIDGMACGDVDNDGDIDIFLAGDQTGILFINQINDPLLGANVGTPMTFVQDSYTFYSGDGEGSSFVDVDNDGDLDLYVNIRNGNNRLFINQLSGTPSNNYLFVDIKENRASANMPSGAERDALGATLRLVDCEGNVISGIREINGGNGHGTQDVARIHFGLPNGPADYYILQASYPNIVGEDRYQINEEIRPADYAYHLYEIAPAASTNNAPEGQNDIIYYTENTTITIDVIADNGNGVDSDPDGDPLTVMTTLGTSPSNGTAIVNANNTITYTPDADFIGIDSFTYYLSDNPTCPAAGMTEEVTVELIYQGSLDNCVIGFDPYTWTQISPNDDGSVGPVALPFDFDLYGTTYSSVYINNNGNVSFDNPYWWYTSTGFPITTPMVAPFWGDVDTRDWFANGYQGEVWYNVTPDAIYVTWMNVGPYYAGNAAHDDLQDTFTLVMSDGSGTVLAPGNNVAFFYGDMDWTTGSASGGTNGFGGSPATVGINAGNGVDYILMGMFDSDTDDYDGPGGDNDGVNWLEDQCLEFDVSSATNFPPVAQGFPQDNSINVCYGETQDITLGFTGPEFAETVSISMNDYAWSGVTVNSNTTGNPGEIDLTLSGDAVGTYLLTFTATDNNSSPETTVVDLTVNVIDCNCSAPPSVICPPTISVDTDAGSCDATVSVLQPSVLSSCFGFNALDFGATGDYVGLQDIVPNGDFSIEFWFQPEASSWSGTLFDMSEDNAAVGSNQRYFYISGDDSGMTFAFESDDDADIQIDANYDFSEVRWYHIVAVGTFGANDQHQLYIDGTLAGSDDTNTSAKPSTYELPRIGTYGSAYLVPQNEFNGLIDNFRIYDTRLNSATVNEIACGDLTAVPNNIVTNLDFEDGAGSAQASDVSINGNNGALVNMDINTAWVYSDLVMECMTVTNDYNGTEDASGTYPLGTTTVTWTVTNTAGASSSCTHDVIVADTENPTATCQNMTLYLDASGQASLDPSDIEVSSSDNCGIADISLSQTTFDCADLTAPLVVSSANGYDVIIDVNAVSINTATASCPWGYSYTVELDYDVSFTGVNIPSNLYTLQGTIGCDPANHFFNLPNSGGSGSVTSANSYNSDSDCATATPESLGCNTITIQISGPGIPETFIVMPSNTVPVDLIVEDNAGNIGTCTADITIIDDIAPTITCAADISTSTNAAGCTANVTVPAPSTADNCSVASLTNDYNGTASANDNYPVGTTTITWTVTDNSGNTATCTQNITVTNNLSANAGTNVTICEGESTTLTASATGSGPFNYLWDSGLGMGESHTVSPIPSAYANENFTYNVTVTDANGCTDTDQVTVTVESTPDATYTTVDPTCGLNNGSITFNFIDHPNRTGIEFSIDGGSSYESTVADNSGSVTYNGLAPGSYTLITRWGNNECPITLGTAVLTDIDNTPPTVSCPSNISVGANAAGCNASVSVPPVTANDNCSIASIVNDYTGTSDASGTYPVGTTTVNWTVTDYNGNTATCSMTVTVVDDVDPTITCPANISVGTDADDCFATVALGTPTTDDNCAVASVSNDAPATFPIGTTNVTWTV
ncbi:MAG: FG-GAP-like repeat-containing protein, partial [Flavobacteriales bacterium]|nr:FG-GAP-like repeat-containing protein [Flavobacteriales bacterium]